MKLSPNIWYYNIVEGDEEVDVCAELVPDQLGLHVVVPEPGGGRGGRGRGWGGGESRRILHSLPRDVRPLQPGRDARLTQHAREHRITRLAGFTHNRYKLNRHHNILKFNSTPIC